MTESDVSLREYLERMLDESRRGHGEIHAALMAEHQRLRDAWRADALQWRESHSAAHEAHAVAHDKEHSLNQQAISKAEASVDKAVFSARETMETNIGAQAARIDHLEDEQQRRLDEVRATIHQMNLSITSLTRTAESNAKAIQSLAESQTWVVRLLVGAILMALLVLIIRPALMTGIGG
jgi:hypothetical protein